MSHRIAESLAESINRPVRFAQGKALAARVLCHPFVGTLLGQVYGNLIPSRGASIDTSGAIAPAVKAYLFWGVYESAEIRFVERYLRRDLDVVELGSSLGVVACHIAKRLDRARRLVCVEANGLLLGRIRENLDRNAPRASVTIMHGAVDYSVNPGTEIQLVLGETNLTSVTVANSSGTKPSGQAPSTTLGTILQQESIEDYTLVSDIEGAEAAMLVHDGEALSRCRQVIVELHQARLDNRTYTVQDLVETIVQRLGFTLRSSHGPVYVFEK